MSRGKFEGLLQKARRTSIGNWLKQEGVPFREIEQNAREVKESTPINASANLKTAVQAEVGAKLRMKLNMIADRPPFLLPESTPSSV